ncbi:hypothetical protein QUF91_18395 [Lysinibacillus sp. G4S2]|nr:hypothetical protein [Lysinibacillus sp. G4S2]
MSSFGSSAKRVVDFFDRKSSFFDKSPNSFDKMRFCFDKSSNSFDKERFCFDKSSKYSYKTNERSFSDSILELDTKTFTKITLITLFFNIKKRVFSCAETTLFLALRQKKRGVIGHLVVAVASLSHRAKLLGVSDEPLHSRCSLQGLICDANFQGVAKPERRSTNTRAHMF